MASFPGDNVALMDDYTVAFEAFKLASGNQNLAPSWGEGLFENAEDLKVVCRLDHEAGLLKHVERLNGFDEMFRNNVPLHVMIQKALGGGGVLPSMLSLGCTNEEMMEVARKHMDGGVLKRMCERMVKSYFKTIKKEDYTAHGYLPVLLGACATSIGCKLDGIPGYHKFFGSYRDLLRGIYETAPIMDKAKEQMEKALQGYTDGVPWVFDSVLHPEAMVAREAAGFTKPLSEEKFWGERWSGGLPVGYRSERGTGKAPLGGLFVATTQPMSKADMGYDDSSDAGCGHKGCGKHDAVLQCSKCKDVKYCGPRCQKGDWKRHKEVCRKPEDVMDMRGNKEKWTNFFYFDPRDEMKRLVDSGLVPEALKNTVEQLGATRLDMDDEEIAEMVRREGLKHKIRQDFGQGL